MNIRNALVLGMLVLILTGCVDSNKNTLLETEEGWVKESQLIKVIENVHFNFPVDSYANENKADFISQCFEAISLNSQLIGIQEFNDTIQIRFLNSRDDMFWLTRSAASGIAYPHINTLYVVADGEKSPPIKHELMHLIAMLKWGYPDNSSTWINEGLAALAENNCNGLTVSELYRYFLENEMLIPIDSLVSNFYGQPEMIAYHQSAFVVKYLLEKYTIEQYKELWTSGMGQFEMIYGASYSDMKAEIEEYVLKQHPKVADIDWGTFKEGCN